MDWNVIVSVQQHGYQAAKILLRDYGKIKSTEYFNILVMQVGGIEDFLEDMHALYEMQAPALVNIGRIMPVSQRFVFQTVNEFETLARDVVAGWLDELAGRHFYVRMHRRGFKGRLSSQEEERFLDEFILEQLSNSGKAAARVDFSGAERIVAVETLGQQAGMSLWTREDLLRYPFLKLD